MLTYQPLFPNKIYQMNPSFMDVRLGCRLTGGMAGLYYTKEAPAKDSLMSFSLIQNVIRNSSYRWAALYCQLYSDSAVVQGTLFPILIYIKRERQRPRLPQQYAHGPLVTCFYQLRQVNRCVPKLDRYTWGHRCKYVPMYRDTPLLYVQCYVCAHWEVCKYVSKDPLIVHAWKFMSLQSLKSRT